MAEEYFINSQSLQNKVRQLLPSQGGLGQGQDLTATTQIVPIIDLTETAEGSDVRPDLQTALSFGSTTAFSVNNTTTTVISNTGYYRIFGSCRATGSGAGEIQATDGATTKTLIKFPGTTSTVQVLQFDFNVFVAAGESIVVTTNNTAVDFNGVTRQIATIDGTLVDP
jgi:hypothetical protein